MVYIFKKKIMKTIHNTLTDEIKRLDDSKAENLVGVFNSNWRYVPKKEWKEKVRDVKKTEPKNQKNDTDKNNGRRNSKKSK